MYFYFDFENNQIFYLFTYYFKKDGSGLPKTKILGNKSRKLY